MCDRPIRRGTHRMFDHVAYYAKTFAETVPAIFGIRGLFEQPGYVVREELGGGLEIREYGSSVAAEATVAAATREEASETAFRLLFGYITGANRVGQMVAMTAPVRTDAAATGGAPEVSMRFTLPAKVAADPPAPTDGRVRIVTVAASTVAALRYSGNPTEAARRVREVELLRRLEGGGWRAVGVPYVLNYDPPFTVPFLKRNEVVVEVERR